MTTTLNHADADRLLVEEATVRNDQATPEWLKESGGVPIRAVRERRKADPRWQSHLLEANRLYEKVLSGNAYAAMQFVEAMSTSDFPLLFADVLDREMLGAYQDWPSTWPSIARRGTVRDFRSVKRFFLDGGSAVLGEVPQRSEYPEAKLDEGKYEYAVTKRGRILDLAWETLVNDDLDTFRDMPGILGRAARLTEDKFATQLYVSSTGPNAAFFSVGNANLLAVADVTATPGGTGATTTALSVYSLQAAFTKLGSQKDPDGNPIYYQEVVLVVPPALEVTAQAIINATEIRYTTGNSQVVAQNWMRNRTRLLVDPWQPIVNTTNGNSAWYLVGVPSLGRPAMEIGFLRSRATPDLFVKSPNALRVGGGMAPVEDGDFETDSIRHKVRHVLGGTLMDSKAAVAATGGA